MSNRLAQETSPYLLQHADNPVDWYPWGEEAFALAREQGKPVLLSIGYSACHWCHVMAHESFEDEATAELMNRLFVNIKVDREERPDVDKIYQTAHQLLTSRGGGWPLTMFLSPNDQKPFFGGTYFPDTPRHGMPSFGELLQSIATYFADKPDDITAQGERLDDVFRRLEPETAENAALNTRPLQQVRDVLAESFDGDFGGFGGAPKFPHPTNIDRLLRHWSTTVNEPEPDIDALFMASLSLTRMAEGGIFDHVGGGFCRYSVDRYWQIPHFEKMLYDNGALLASYAQAFQATGETMFATTATRTAEWILSMRADGGGIHASLDADSEGEEGKFYVWTPDAVRDLINKDDYDLFAARFGLDAAANFEGHWHLTVRKSITDLASEFNRGPEAVEIAINEALATLESARSQRIPPGLDDKVLTSWNALAARGLAIAGRALGRKDFTDAAGNLIDFLYSQLFVDGRLFATFKNDTARFQAYLDDHAFLIDAILESLQSRWNTTHLHFATALADLLLEQFEDTDNGGFFFTANDHEALMTRPRPMADEAVPSGNGVAATALLRLGHLIGDTRYLDAAERALLAGWRAIEEYPHGHVSLVNALDDYQTPPELIVLRGAEDAIEAWRAPANVLYTPARMVFAIPADEVDLPGLLAERAPKVGTALAYRCRGMTCDLPIEINTPSAQSLWRVSPNPHENR
ncbi:MAG: thioredoxin domain-containing protein [Pseudomonadota bacterium]